MRTSRPSSAGFTLWLCARFFSAISWRLASRPSMSTPAFLRLRVAVSRSASSGAESFSPAALRPRNAAIWPELNGLIPGELGERVIGRERRNQVVPLDVARDVGVGNRSRQRAKQGQERGKEGFQHRVMSASVRGHLSGVRHAESAHPPNASMVSELTISSCRLTQHRPFLRISSRSPSRTRA